MVLKYNGILNHLLVFSSASCLSTLVQGDEDLLDVQTAETRDGCRGLQPSPSTSSVEGRLLSSMVQGNQGCHITMCLSQCQGWHWMIRPTGSTMGRLEAGEDPWAGGQPQPPPWDWEAGR